MKVDAIINNGMIASGFNKGQFLIGYIESDSKGRFQDGAHVQTSEIVEIFVVTKNSTYRVFMRPHPMSWMP